MKKWISVLLACIFCMTSIGFVPTYMTVSNAEEAVLTAPSMEPTTTPEQPSIPAGAHIFIEEDFDKARSGDASKSGIFRAATAKHVQIVSKGGSALGRGNGSVRFWRADGIEESVNAQVSLAANVKSLVIEYAFMQTSGATMQVIFYEDSGNKGTIFNSSKVDYLTYDDWNYVRLELDLENLTVTYILNGTEEGSTEIKELTGDGKDMYLRIVGLLPYDEAIYLDAMNIYTLEEYVEPKPEEEEKPAVELTEPPMEPTTTPIKAEIPDGAAVLVEQDFENVPQGDASKSGIFRAATAQHIQFLTAGGNGLTRFWRSDGIENSLQAQVTLSDKVDTFVIDYAFMQTPNATMKVLLYDGAGSKGTLFSGDKANSLTYDDWNYLHIELDLNDMTATYNLNGEDEGSANLVESVDRETAVYLRLIGLLPYNEAIYLDELSIYTLEEYNTATILYGDQQVMWENVKPQNPLSGNSYVNNLKAHPRLLIHDWDEMRAKLNTSMETKQWYQEIKAYADQCLADGMAEFFINSNGNAANAIREIEGRLMCLSFMYKMTGERKYFERALAEAKAYGDWPHWSGFSHSLTTAEGVWGYAYMYDWLYDDLSAEQKKMLIDIVKKHGLPQFIYDYENNTGGVASVNNWNPVCNGSMLAAAFAFADEEKNLSEYLLENGLKYVVRALEPYAPQGMTDEGASYWGYATAHLCFIMDMVDNNFVDGFELPDAYKYFMYPGISETGDFPIYFSSSVGQFNYGDAGRSTGGFANEALYWLADKFNKPQYAWVANKTQRDYGYMKPDTGSYIMAYKPIFAYASYNPQNASLEPGTFALDRFYDSPDNANGFTMRSSWDSYNELFAGMEGGYTTVWHMYYSLGTYVIDWDGARFICEDTNTDYSYQGDKEKVYYKRAEAHNTLIMNPTAAAEQEPNEGAFVVKSGSSDNTAYGILDMSYTHKDYKTAFRGMMMTDGRRRVIVRDEVKAKRPSEFYWFNSTQAEITIAEDGRSVLLEQDGARMLLRMLEAPEDARFAVMEHKSLIDGIINMDQPGKKLFVHMENVQDLNFAVEYVGLKDGEGIPAPWEVKPLAEWSADDNGLSTVASAGSAVVLKLDTPNAIAKGEKTYVDIANYDVAPFTQNDRTLVPVRFISESFGAKVGWDDATQTVTVNYGDKAISLQIGSNQMYVNGEAATLDVPANTYNSRTLIPLRALVEALGKYVHWDDRGLIIISDDSKPFDADTVNKMIAELNVRITVNGQDMTFFSLDRENYVLNVKSEEAVPQIDVATIGTENVSVTQANAVGETATVSIDGKVYNIKIENDPFEGAKSNADPEMLNALTIAKQKKAGPTHNTFIYVEDIESSISFVDRPKRSIVDGVLVSNTEHAWSCEGPGWVQMDFGAVKNVYSMAFAGAKQESRNYYFDIEISQDGVNWTKIHDSGSQTTQDWMSIIPFGNVQARYVKLVGRGNNTSAWNTWLEVRFYESEAQQKEDMSYWSVYFDTIDVSGKVGETIQLIAKGVDIAKNEFELREDTQLSYAVADPSIATVSADGKVTCLKAGRTTVIVRAQQGDYHAMAEVEVVVE